MQLAFDLILIFSFSILLIKGTELTILGLKHLAKATGLERFALTSFLLALATSIPELFVGVVAALEGRPGLALGNVIGSNIANISLVAGGAVLIGGTIGVVGEFLKKDIFSVFLAGALPMILLLDNSLSRVDGLILLFIYGAYNWGILNGRKRKIGLENEVWLRRFLRHLGKEKAGQSIASMFLGMALLLFSAEMLVKVAQNLALDMKMPVFLIGLFVVAIGTSLPELSFEIGAIRRKQVGMMFGDLLGSVVANSTLILGIVSLINPIYLTNGLEPYLLATVFFAAIFALFWYFVRTKRKLERWEGVVLILVYLAFAWLEFRRHGG
ncbi:sodium:calcium antiporter [Patescibacteria group bacterium]|nr:sodium:calcium antiporter [Patescibacteria group bacterium]MBU1931376.1 sodium:calcium antiporter [Patescibacteria group bacterium]